MLFFLAHEDIAAVGAALTGLGGFGSMMVAARLAHDRATQIAQDDCQQHLHELENEYRQLMHDSIQEALRRERR